MRAASTAMDLGCEERVSCHGLLVQSDTAILPNNRAALEEHGRKVVTEESRPLSHPFGTERRWMCGRGRVRNWAT